MRLNGIRVFLAVKNDELAYPLPVQRPFRIGLRILAGFGAVVVISAVLCLDGVDTQPYFRQPYSAETTARMRAELATNTVIKGELEAGFGRARLSPTVNVSNDVPKEGRFQSLSLAGYGGRHGKPATGVHDDIYVKAVALKVKDRIGVMLGADALIIPPEVTDLAMRRLMQESRLTRDQVYLSATHTHSSLGGWGQGLVAEAFAGGFKPEVRTWFADCIVSAVQQALADLKPAQFGHGQFSAPQFIRNRLVGELGKVDPEFSYAVLKHDAGKVAVLGVYGAHATILSSGNMQFSADYPGYWQRAVEQDTAGLALFLAGGVGSHSAVPGASGLEGAEKMGTALARALLEKLPQTPLTNTVAFDILGLDVTLPQLNVRISDGVRLRPWVAARLLPARGHTFLQVFRINDSLWISTPCDFSGELALGIKDFVRARGFHATVTSFNGDYVGYVIPSRYYHLDGYEPRLMSFFGPNVPDYFDELIRSMATALATN